MYSTCIFCYADLGSNESVEHFPIGRRLAFDASRGRLWVVCRKCERWNLTPLEDRWEAIEECERLFSATRLRVSTDNMGLARLREGLELVRVGSPLRPEMAAWRYGDQFGRRRTRRVAYTAAGAAVLVGLFVLGPVTGIIAGSSGLAINLANTAHNLYRQRRVHARLALPDIDGLVTIRERHLSRVRVERVEEVGDWALRVAYETRDSRFVPLSNGRAAQPSRSIAAEQEMLLRGAAALTAASKLLPAINAWGATRPQVDAAVRMIGEIPEPSMLFARYVAGSITPRKRGKALKAEPELMLSKVPKEIRLAFEMATHETSERRALEGELALLEEEWKQAEEVAAIADEMFVSDETRLRLTKLRDVANGTDGSGGP